MSADRVVIEELFLELLAAPGIERLRRRSLEGLIDLAVEQVDRLAGGGPLLLGQPAQALDQGRQLPLAPEVADPQRLDRLHCPDPPIPAPATHRRASMGVHDHRPARRAGPPGARPTGSAPGPGAS